VISDTLLNDASNGGFNAYIDGYTATTAATNWDDALFTANQGSPD
jgi:hypothetical protein